MFFILVSLVVYGLFPVNNQFQQLVVMVSFFAIIPVIFNKVILKRRLGDIGLKIGDWKQGLFWSGVGIVVAGLLFFIAIYFFNFLKHYTIPTTITYNYKNFLFYEFLLVVPVVFLYDLFFRGFVMLILDIKIYYWAIVAQMLIFFIFIVATNSLTWDFVPYLISAPLVGVVTYKSGSIFYSTLFQSIIIIMLDANIVRLVK